jgi:hypothetical protein
MNAAERQALRERHAEEYGLCVYCFVPDTYNGRVGEWMPALYPCDTIKVLDAWEAMANLTQIDTITTALQLRAQGMKYQEIADWLNAAGMLTPKGKQWDKSNIMRTMYRHGAEKRNYKQRDKR